MTLSDTEVLWWLTEIWWWLTEIWWWLTEIWSAGSLAVLVSVQVGELLRGHTGTLHLPGGQYTVYSLHYTVYSIQYRVYSLQYAVTLNSNTCTLHLPVYGLQFREYSNSVHADCTFLQESIQYKVYSILGDTARYAGLLIAPAEGSGLQPRFFLPFGQKRRALFFAVLAYFRLFLVFSSKLSNF